MGKFKTAAIIGYGSIGKRHAYVLKKLKLFNRIYIVTNQKLVSNFKKLKSIKDLKKINPDYFVICSDTNKHFQHLKYIVNNYTKKIIFVEKPLFEKIHKLKIKKNKIFIGYNFRFNPIIKYIKNFLRKKKILTATVLCGSYLPNWRNNIKHYKSYSYEKKRGGGVLLDLSHEFDYMNWILGPLKKKYSLHQKISSLKISSNDFLSFIGSSDKVKYLYMNLDYFSKISKRKIILEGDNFSLHADLLNNFIKLNFFSKSKLIKFSKSSTKNSYVLQHKNILTQKKKIACTYNEAIQLTSFLDKI